jgi:hypothetical protein
VTVRPADLSLLGDGELTVRGGASDEELAAVIAALASRPEPPESSGYEKWRRARRAALSRLDAQVQARS